MPTAVRRLWDHFDTGPSGVDAQSNVRIRVAISLSPTNGDTLVPGTCVTNTSRRPAGACELQVSLTTIA